jgi:hypothetical protein
MPVPVVRILAHLMTRDHGTSSSFKNMLQRDPQFVGSLIEVVEKLGLHNCESGVKKDSLDLVEQMQNLLDINQPTVLMTSGLC